jgi:hypothetical protein
MSARDGARKVRRTGDIGRYPVFQGISIGFNFLLT